MRLLEAQQKKAPVPGAMPAHGTPAACCLAKTSAYPRHGTWPLAYAAYPRMKRGVGLSADSEGLSKLKQLAITSETTRAASIDRVD
jgi:hypothetical protein